MIGTMAGLKLESEEYQATLRDVLKSEIQFLLERLSQTGEETVVLTANTGESCTGHLASPNAERFVDLDDIGKLKNKFLFFLKGASKASARPEAKLASPASTPSKVSNVSAANTLSDYDSGAVSDAAKRQELKSSTPSQAGTKRQLETPNASQAAVSGPAPKARKLDTDVPTSTAAVGSSPGPRPRPISTTAQAAAAAAEALKGGTKMAEVKLSTTKVVSRSGGFTEERLSDAEFKKILQHVNNGESDSEEIDEEEYSEDDYDGGHLEEGEIRFSQTHPNFMKMNTFQGPNQTPSTSMSKLPVNQPPTVNNSKVKTAPQTVSVNPAGKAVEGKSDSGDSKSALDRTGGANGPKADGGPGRRQNAPVGGKDLRLGDSGVRINPIQMPEILEEPDPHDMAYRKSKERLRSAAGTGADGDAKGRGDNKPDQEKKVVATTASTLSKGGQATSRFPITDDLDTETLIKMTKASRKENMSEADQAIEAKLGQLSSKLSWVVEYPKDSSGQRYPQRRQVMLEGDKEQYMEGEDEEEEEEDYEEEDEDEDLDNVDEEGLDDEDKAVLMSLRKRRAEMLRQENEEMAMYEQHEGLEAGYHVNMEAGYHEDEEEGYNDEELEEMEEGGFDEYGEYVAVDGSGMHDPSLVHQMGQHGLQQAQYLGHGAEVAPLQGNNFVARPTSPSFENFLLMGPVLAKCLVCNKIVRKTEVKQHNQLHVDELNEVEGMEEGEEEEEENYEEGEGGGEEEEEGEENFEDYEGTEEDGDAENEFVAEKFVAENVTVAKEADTEKPSTKGNSTVCDICNKSFKSASNMQRHKKIHNTREILCPVCSKSFKLHAYMLKHLKKIHPDYKEPEVDVKGKKGSAKVCSDKESPTDHMKTHT